MTKELTDSTIVRNLKTYEEFMSYFKELIPQLNPNWTNTGDDDLGMVIVKLIAILGDNLSYRIDKTSLEHYLNSVRLRENAQGLLNLIGYYMKNYVTSSTTVSISWKPEVLLDERYDAVIPAFSRFTTDSNDVSYYTLDSCSLLSTATKTDVRVYEGTYVEESFTTDQIDIYGRLYLSNDYVASNACAVTYNKTIQLRLVDNIATSTSAKQFQVIRDKLGNTYIQLDTSWKSYIDTSKSLPIKVQYLMTSLDENLVGTGKLTQIAALGPSGTALTTVNVTNDSIASGWSYPESIEDARANAPKFARIMNTLVTLQDYEDFISTLSTDFVDVVALDMNYADSGLKEPYELVIIILTENGELSESQIELVSSEIDTRRLGTIKYTVIPAEHVQIPIKLGLHIAETDTPYETILALVKRLIQEYMSKLEVGQSFYTSDLLKYLHNSISSDILKYIVPDSSMASKYDATQREALRCTNPDLTITIG